MKVLCICEGGNVRSRALAYLLHDVMGHEAIPVGLRWMTPETLLMLGEWADRIVVMQEWMKAKIPVQFGEKVRCLEVGPDTYGLNINPELMAKVSAGARAALM